MAAVDYVKEHPQTNLLHFWLGDYFSNTCECEGCTKMVYSDYYALMINDITEELVKMGSQAKVIFCICYDTLQPPNKHPHQAPGQGGAYVRANIPFLCRILPRQI